MSILPLVFNFDPSYILSNLTNVLSIYGLFLLRATKGADCATTSTKNDYEFCKPTSRCFGSLLNPNVQFHALTH